MGKNGKKRKKSVNSVDGTSDVSSDQVDHTDQGDQGNQSNQGNTSLLSRVLGANEPRIVWSAGRAINFAHTEWERNTAGDIHTEIDRKETIRFTGWCYTSQIR